MINTVFLKKIKGLKFNGFQSLDWHMCMQEWFKKIGIGGSMENQGAMNETE